MTTSLTPDEQSDLIRLTSLRGWGKWFLDKVQTIIPTFSRPVLIRLRKLGNAEEEYVKAAQVVLKLPEAKNHLSVLKMKKPDAE